MSLVSRRRELIPSAILVIGILLTVGAGRYAYDTGGREDDLRFQNEAQRMLDAISGRIDAYVAMLLGGAGLFAASEDVTGTEFRDYVERLQLERRYPGIQGIGFSRRIRADERHAILTSIRREHPAFRFWPDGGGDDFTAIMYLEPNDARNRLALGFNMASEANRAEAMERARDSASPVATGKVRLVQEGSDAVTAQAGFLIYVPVYKGGSVPSTQDERRRRLLGFVYSPFRTDDLLRSIGKGSTSPIRFDVFDGAEANEPALMHRSDAWRPNPPFELVRTIDIAERPWTVVLYADEVLGAAANRTLVALVAIGGTILSVLLFVVVRGQVNARTSAERTAEELRRSEERLRLADRAKDEFLATVSHELRTPLNAIVGWTSMLGRGTLPRDMQSHAIEVIARNASAQSRLVEDLLDMSRVAAGHLRLHVTDAEPAAIMRLAVDGFRPAATEAGIALIYEQDNPLGIIEADSGRLQQIVSNLLSNSIKFTPSGGTITMHAACNTDSLVITVTDTGIGMAPEFVPYVFERFRQADSSTTRAHPGTGLGLAIARHLVELHGGSIHATSAGVGSGATFTVRLPRRQSR